MGIEEKTTLVDSLMFCECPRWHNGKLWFSDVHGLCVMTVGLDGKTEKIVEVTARPSGLGFLPDGKLLVVAIRSSQLLRLDEDGLTVVADLSNQAKLCSDMVVNKNGNAYIACFSYTLEEATAEAPAWITMVSPNGESRIVAEEIGFLNGMVITSDGKTLIAAAFVC